MLARAGERAESLAAAAEARRYYEQAARLADEPSERAVLLARAGEMAARAGDLEAARPLFEESIALYEGMGDTHAAARVLGKLGRIDFFTERRDEAMARMERAFAVISGTSPTRTSRSLAARLALGYWYGADLERAAERAELALDIAEAHAYPAALARRAAREGRAVLRAGAHRGGVCAPQAGAADLARPRPRRRTRARAISSSPTGASGATRTSKRSDISTKLSHSLASSGAGRTSGL